MVALAASAVRSGFNYAVLEADALEGYVSLYGQYNKEREGFTYNDGKDIYRCSQGKELINKGIKALKGYFNYYYRSSATDCKNCLRGPAQLNNPVVEKVLAKN